MIYAYNVATMEDGTDVMIPASMGTPCSDDEVEMPRTQTNRPIGPRMAEALEYIRTHPGVCKADVFRNTGVRRSTNGDDPINRLLRRRLVKDLGPRHRYALYATSDTPRPPVMRDRLARRDQYRSEPLRRPIDPEPVDDGYWRPAGHP